MVSIEFIKDPKSKATYQITVKGKLDSGFMKRLNNLCVSHAETNGNTISIITGNIDSQEALNGLLNILYDHQYPVISVMKIDVG